DVPLLTAIDWTREEVFKSEHDSRKRISLVNAKMCETAAVKIDMVIYPAGSEAPKYYHEGSDTFVYLVSGRGVAWANEPRHPSRAGDLICFPEREMHSLKADDAGDMRFLEIYLPGTFTTVWADRAKKSAWLSTDRDINNRETLQDEKLRRAFRFTNFV